MPGRLSSAAAALAGKSSTTRDNIYDVDVGDIMTVGEPSRQPPRGRKSVADDSNVYDFEIESDSSSSESDKERRKKKKSPSSKSKRTTDNVTATKKTEPNPVDKAKFYLSKYGKNTKTSHQFHSHTTSSKASTNYDVHDSGSLPSDSESGHFFDLESGPPQGLSTEPTTVLNEKSMPHSVKPAAKTDPTDKFGTTMKGDSFPDADNSGAAAKFPHHLQTVASLVKSTTKVPAINDGDAFSIDESETSESHSEHDQPQPSGKANYPQKTRPSNEDVDDQVESVEIEDHYTNSFEEGDSGVQDLAEQTVSESLGSPNVNDNVENTRGIAVGAQTLKEGMKVKALYAARAGGTEYFGGVIAQRNDDGTYRINYEDGDEEDGVLSIHIKPLQNGRDDNAAERQEASENIVADDEEDIYSEDYEDISVQQFSREQRVPMKSDLKLESPFRETIHPNAKDRSGPTMKDADKPRLRVSRSTLQEQIAPQSTSANTFHGMPHAGQFSHGAMPPPPPYGSYWGQNPYAANPPLAPSPFYTSAPLPPYGGPTHGYSIDPSLLANFLAQQISGRANPQATNSRIAEADKNNATNHVERGDGKDQRSHVSSGKNDADSNRSNNAYTYCSDSMRRHTQKFENTVALTNDMFSNHLNMLKANVRHLREKRIRSHEMYQKLYNYDGISDKTTVDEATSPIGEFEQSPASANSAFRSFMPKTFSSTATKEASAA